MCRFRRSCDWKKRYRSTADIKYKLWKDARNVRPQRYSPAKYYLPVSHATKTYYRSWVATRWNHQEAVAQSDLGLLLAIFNCPRLAPPLSRVEPAFTSMPRETNTNSRELACTLVLANGGAYIDERNDRIPSLDCPITFGGSCVELHSHRLLCLYLLAN